LTTLLTFLFSEMSAAFLFTLFVVLTIKENAAENCILDELVRCFNNILEHTGGVDHFFLHFKVESQF